MAEHPDRPHIVVGVVAEQPDSVVREAAEFAKRLAADLVLATVDPTRYTVAETPEGGVEAFPLDPDAADDVIEEFEPEFAKRLASLLEPTGVPYSFRALAGEPAQELGRIAEEVDAEAIVIGTRNPGFRAAAHEFFNGSVAVHLAHRQHRPVIVIPLNPVPHGERLPWEAD